MQVLDASAFIEGFEASGPVATTPAVRDELRDAAVYRFEAMQGSGMRVHVPGESSLDRVDEAATQTGDADVLSAVDRGLVAAALELDATLVTDDYAMQNVAERLGVEVAVVAQEGIEEQREWVFQCQGCGRVFEEHHDRCPICGTGLSRKNPS